MSTRLGVIIEANEQGFTLSWEKPNFSLGIVQETDPKKAEEFAKKMEYTEFSICLYIRKMVEHIMNMRNQMVQEGAVIDAEGADSGRSNEAGTNGEVGQGGSPVASPNGQPDGDQTRCPTHDGDVLGVSGAG